MFKTLEQMAPMPRPTMPRPPSPPAVPTPAQWYSMAKAPETLSPQPSSQWPGAQYGQGFGGLTPTGGSWSPSANPYLAMRSPGLFAATQTMPQNDWLGLLARPR